MIFVLIFGALHRVNYHQFLHLKMTGRSKDAQTPMGDSNECSGGSDGKRRPVLPLRGGYSGFGSGLRNKPFSDDDREDDYDHFSVHDTKNDGDMDRLMSDYNKCTIKDGVCDPEELYYRETEAREGEERRRYEAEKAARRNRGGTGESRPIQGNFRPGQFPSKQYPTWLSFETHFRAVSKINAWSNEQSRDMLAYCLNSDALDEWVMLPQSVKEGSLNGCLKALKNRLGEDVDPRMNRTKFRSLAQDPTESLVDFSRRVKMMARRCYTEADDNTIDVTAREQFIEGVYDPDVRFELMKAEIEATSFEKLVNAARRLDAIKTAEAYRARNRSKTTTQQARVVTEQLTPTDEQVCTAKQVHFLDKNLPVNQLEGTLNNLNLSLTAINNTLTRFEGSMRTSFDKMDGRLSDLHRNSQPKGFTGGFPDKPRNRPDISTVKCFDCNTMGHYATSCPLRANTNATGHLNGQGAQN